MCHLLQDSAPYKEKHHIEHMAVNPFLLISNTPRNHGLIRDLHIFGAFWDHTMGVFDFWGMIFLILMECASSQLQALPWNFHSLRIPLLAFRIFGDRRPLHASRLCGQD